MNIAVISRVQVLLAALLFSTAGAAIKLCSLSSWQVAGFRAGIAAVVLWLVMPAGANVSWRTLVVSFAYASQSILFVAGNKLTTAASTIFLQATAPLYILLLSPWLLAERVQRRDLGFALVLAAGLGLFFVGDEPVLATAPRPLLGNFVAALGGIAWALTIMSLRWMGKRESGAAGSLAAALVAGNILTFLLCLPLALPLRFDAAGDWGVVLYLGLVQVGLSYIFLGRGIRHVPAFEASLLLLLEPVLNPVWAWIVHKERPGAWSLAGGALIIAATVAKAWVDGRRRTAGAVSRE